MQKYLQKKFLGLNITTLFFFVFIILLTFFLRFYLIPQNLFFGPEQGRDLLVVKDIAQNHKLTLIGPKTDISGIFHGPLFYYMLVIPFIISAGDPLAASVFLIIIQSLTVIAVYFLGKEIANKRVGVIAAILYAVSLSAILYARWLSNPPLSIPFAVLSMLFLFKYLKGDKKSLIGYSVFIGLLNQAEFLNLLFYSVFTLIVVIIFFKSFKKSGYPFLMINFLISIIISAGTFVLFDLRHQFLITKSVLGIFSNREGFHIAFVDSIYSNITGFLNSFSLTILPLSEIFGAIIFLIMVAFSVRNIKKQNDHIVLVLWLLIPLVLLIFLRHGALEQFFVSLIPAFIILTALIINKLWSMSKYAGIALFCIIIFFQIVAWAQRIPNNKKIFFQSTQLELRYVDQTRTINRIYKEAENTPFAIQAYTIPYWSQEAWQYLFWSYGSKKYARLPIAQKDAKKLFVIIQDDPRNVPYQKDWLKNTVSTWGTKENEFRYGILTTRELKLK